MPEKKSTINKCNTCFFGRVLSQPFFMHLLKKSAGTCDFLFTVGIGFALYEPGTLDCTKSKSSAGRDLASNKCEKISHLLPAAKNLMICTAHNLIGIKRSAPPKPTCHSCAPGARELQQLPIVVTKYFPKYKSEAIPAPPAGAKSLPLSHTTCNIPSDQALLALKFENLITQLGSGERLVGWRMSHVPGPGRGVITISDGRFRGHERGATKCAISFRTRAFLACSAP
jgi:hypothetical protein